MVPILGIRIMIPEEFDKRFANRSDEAVSDQLVVVSPERLLP